MARMLSILCYVAALCVWWRVCGHFFQAAAKPEIRVASPSASQERRPRMGVPPEVMPESKSDLRLSPELGRFSDVASSEAAAPTKKKSFFERNGFAAAAPAATAEHATTAPATAAATAAATAVDTRPRPAAGEAGPIAAVVHDLEQMGKECPQPWKPYHTLLTAQGTIYNGWQARIMYYHWKRQAAAGGKCTEMTGFTRLCPSPDGKPDGVEKFIPTYFLKQLTPDFLAKHNHFGVLNRPVT